MGPVISTLCAVIGRLLAGEIKAWLPWLTEQVTRVAVKGLPEEMRERYSEEWQSHLNDVPGEIAKLVVAMGFVRATLKSSVVELFPYAVGRLFALFALISVGPGMLVVCLGVKLSSRGSIVSRREMVGRGGRRFGRFKFRTMIANCDALVCEPSSRPQPDPRITTTVGKFLRRFSLDELPILLNVLRGEMALIGPAPLPPGLSDDMARRFPDFNERLAVKPGLTGWSQVTSAGLTDREMLDGDLFYVRNKSIKLDLEILGCTFILVFLDRKDS